LLKKLHNAPLDQISVDTEEKESNGEWARILMSRKFKKLEIKRLYGEHANAQILELLSSHPTVTDLHIQVYTKENTGSHRNPAIDAVFSNKNLKKLTVLVYGARDEVIFPPNLAPKLDMLILDSHAKMDYAKFNIKTIKELHLLPCNMRDFLNWGMVNHFSMRNLKKLSIPSSIYADESVPKLLSSIKPHIHAFSFGKLMPEHLQEFLHGNNVLKSLTVTEPFALHTHTISEFMPHIKHLKLAVTDQKSVEAVNSLIKKGLALETLDLILFNDQAMNSLKHLKIPRPNLKLEIFLKPKDHYTVSNIYEMLKGIDASMQVHVNGRPLGKVLRQVYLNRGLNSFIASGEDMSFFD
jgi:hypothetical protein